MDKKQYHKERNQHLERLEKLGHAKVFFKVYKPSQIELNILRWFNKSSSMEIAKKLKIDKSYVYAVLNKFKTIYTKSEESLNSSHD